MLEQKDVTIKAGSSFQTVCPFPVGYIYQSYNSTSPANIYGGSWTPITGRFLYCNSGTSVGGSNTHVLTANEMPRHNHYTVKECKSMHAAGGAGYTVPCIDNYGYNSNMSTSLAGNNAAHNNMPAYQTCYAWRRTS